MEQNKPDQTTPSSGAEKTTDTAKGREPGDRQQTASEPATDISKVDQQEGEMSHGELGGNFNETKETSGA